MDEDYLIELAVSEFRSDPKSIRKAMIAWLVYQKAGWSIPDDVTNAIVPIIEKKLEDDNRRDPEKSKQVQYKNDVLGMLHLAITEPELFHKIVHPKPGDNSMLKVLYPTEVLEPILSSLRGKKYDQKGLCLVFCDLLKVRSTAMEAKYKRYRKKQCGEIIIT